MKYWSTREAWEYLQSHKILVTRQTIVNWISRYALGRQKPPTPKPCFGRGGTWFVDPKLFKGFIEVKYGKSEKNQKEKA